VAVRTPVLGRALVAGSSERGAAGVTGARVPSGRRWKARAGSSWSSTRPGTTGVTGLRGPDDEDTGTGRPLSERDGP